LNWSLQSSWSITVHSSLRLHAAWFNFQYDYEIEEDMPFHSLPTCLILVYIVLIWSFSNSSVLITSRGNYRDKKINGKRVTEIKKTWIYSVTTRRYFIYKHLFVSRIDYRINIDLYDLLLENLFEKLTDGYHLKINFGSMQGRSNVSKHTFFNIFSMHHQFNLILKSHTR
jgi:hypothetical protein